MSEEFREKLSPVVLVALKEYELLKQEEAKRIGFRNSLLYINLSLFVGAFSLALIFSSAFSNVALYVLLLLPWVCLILGWTYLVNEQKIAAIGGYIRHALAERVRTIISTTDYSNIDAIFGWEIAHRSDRRRKRRMIEQLIIDEMTFVISGIIALISFWLLVPQIVIGIRVLIGVELMLLLILGLEIFTYTDLDRRR